MEQKQPIDIVLTTWQREWMTEACIQALRENTRTPYRLIIIDGGSARSAQEYYNEVADIYVKLDKNMGLEYAKNLGMHFVESELFISTDNDILVYKYNGRDWLERLIDLMEENPQYGAIAPRPQLLIGTSMYMFDTSDKLVDFPHVPGYMRIMRTAWVKEVGAWRDRRPLRGHEEIWIGEKFKEKGYKLAWANQVQCWHLFGESDTDMWGYPKGVDPSEHGHQPVWPIAKNDKEEIAKQTGVIL